MKNIFKIGIMSLLIVIFIQIENNFKNRDIFNVSNVQIENISKKLQKDLKEIKDEILNKNINELDLNKVKDKISKDVRVKEVLINKQNINEIIIDIKERKSKYYVQYKNKIYTLSEDGYIFGHINEYPKDGFPIIVLKKIEEKNELLEIMKKLDELDFLDEISQIYVENKKTIIIILRDGSNVRTNNTIPKLKYETFINLYYELLKSKKIEYIDIRFNDIVVKENK